MPYKLQKIKFMEIVMKYLLSIGVFILFSSSVVTADVLKGTYKTEPTVEDLKKLDEKIKRGGGFDSNDLKVINSLQKS